MSSLVFVLSLVVTAWGGDEASADGENGGGGRVELSDVIAVAGEGGCVDDGNRIYGIDGEPVLWHGEDLGCADAGWAVTRYGATPGDELCRGFQTVGGPVTGCTEDRARAGFETIVDNVRDPDLGPGEEHTVELVGDAWDGSGRGGVVVGWPGRVGPLPSALIRRAG